MKEIFKLAREVEDRIHELFTEANSSIDGLLKVAERIGPLDIPISGRYDREVGLITGIADKICGTVWSYSVINTIGKPPRVLVMTRTGNSQTIRIR